MTIAEKMLELLDEGWGKSFLRLWRSPEKVEYRCAVGLRLDAAGMTYICNEALAEDALSGDPVITAMARIIREQYPEAIQDYATMYSNFPAASQAVLSRDVSVVMMFNDRYATEPDIRAVIEKVIAEGL